MSLPKSFWDRVFINEWEPNACWLWEGRIHPSGYGRYSNNYIHRLMFMDFGGIITKEKPCVLHKCHEFGIPDNKLCCNPNHLRAGTSKENMADMISAGIIPAHIAIKNNKLHYFTSSECKINGSKGGGISSLMKTHCAQGHPYNLENTRLYRGERRCRPCSARIARNWRKKHGK